MSRVIRVDFVDNDFFIYDHGLFVIGSTDRCPDPTADGASDDCTVLATDFRSDSRAGTTANRAADHGTGVNCQRRAGKTHCHRKHHNFSNVHIHSFQ